MDYRHAAADVLFGHEVLSNSVRGLYIEALVYNSVSRHGKVDWHYVGLNWGPWDLQRGSHAEDNRVRFQVKVSAEKQLWERQAPARTFSLGWADTNELPGYFLADFPRDLVGEIELTGYRCDFFLLAWHGPHPLTGAPVRRDDQSDPNAYDYFIVPASALTAKSLGVRAVFERFQKPIDFSGLPVALNDAADHFSQEHRPTPPDASASSASPAS